MAGQYVFLPPLLGQVDLDTATPAAIPWVRTVAAGEVWRWNCIGIIYTTNALVATRYVQAECRNAASQILWATTQAVGQAASLVRQYHFQLGGETSAAFVTPGIGSTPQLSHPIPDHYIEPGGTIRVTVINTQAGDSFSAYTAWVQKWSV